MNTNKIFDNIDDLILAFLRGKISATEMDELKQWLSLSNENKSYFKQMYMTWKAGTVTESDAKSVDRAFQKVYSKTFENNFDDADETPNLFIRSLLKWAAVVVISLSAGAVLHYLFMGNRSKPFNAVTLTEINVPLGSKSRIVLPDSTEVWLNAGSKLTYEVNYGEELRIVNLVGEGYFKVFKNPDKPFIVRTANANIRALGTEFNVKAYPDESTMETILVEGSVVVNKINPKATTAKKKIENSILLKPGQKILLFNAANSNLKEDAAPETYQPSSKPIEKKTAKVEITLQDANTEVETSWKDPNWVIQGENIQDLCIKLGRRFNVSIVHLDRGLDKYKFSGIIQKETLEQVFDLMKLTIPMSYSIEKGKVEITLNSKLESKYKRAYNNY